MKKKLVALLMTLCMVFAVVGCGSDDKKAEVKSVYNFGLSKNAKNAFSPNKTESLFGYTFTMPEYLGDQASNSNDSTKYYYAEQTGKVAMFMVQEFPATNMKEDDIEKNAASYMSGVKSSLSGYKHFQDDYVTIAGHNGYREYFDCDMAGFTCHCVVYMFYSESTQKGISVLWGESDNSEFTYFDDVQKIMDALK